MALVMITVNVGTDTDVVNELKRLKHVRGVYEVYSLYDIVVELEADSLDEIWATLNSEIRSIKNIVNTHTLIVARH